MKIIITIKDKNLDKSVDVLIDTCQVLQKKFRGFKEGRCRIYLDGTSISLLV